MRIGRSEYKSAVRAWTSYLNRVKEQLQRACHALLSTNSRYDNSRKNKTTTNLKSHGRK